MPKTKFAKNTYLLTSHPEGLVVLFFTELWERFSYYGMRAILVLYLVSQTDSSNPGLGWSNAEAIKLYGWYTALVYISCIPGGIIADRFLSNQNAVFFRWFITLFWAFITSFSEYGVFLLWFNLNNCRCWSA